MLLLLKKAPTMCRGFLFTRTRRLWYDTPMTTFDTYGNYTTQLEQEALRTVSTVALVLFLAWVCKRMRSKE